MPGFASYSVETQDGRTISGLIASESANNVTLRQALGVSHGVVKLGPTSPSAPATPEEKHDGAGNGDGGQGESHGNGQGGSNGSKGNGASGA